MGVGAAGCVNDGGDEYWEESFMGPGEEETAPLRLSLSDGGI